MRFSLQDIKKKVHRRSGELYVSLHLLRPGELHAEIERLIAYHERVLGQPQRHFSYDDARACVGDYRLADCLITTLSSWYTWRSCEWTEVISRLGDDIHLSLESAGIASPLQLRLVLFNYVNEHYAGFLDTSVRTGALQAFSEGYQLSVPDLEYLLVLDTDEEKLLRRDAPHPPGVSEVARLYNQWAFEAALFNASSVRFVIDCHAFESGEAQSLLPPTSIGTGVGAIIKRLCYLARLLGVYYDLTYDLSEKVPPKGQVSTPLRLQLTLYGPQEMTGVPQQYGLRLARLCRMLLGYRKGNAGASVTIPANAIVEAEATVHFLQRSYSFAIDDNVLSLLPSLTGANDENENGGAILTAPSPATISSVFDSSIEQSFAEAFAALEASHATEGWSLMREPEPLLLKQSIFIPDFAMTRAKRRIYVEILGFWTPSYRERKIQKLQQLQERDDIVLAIPVEAKEAFANIAAHFPIVWYEGQLSATELLQMLRRHYDDLDERLALIDVTTVRQQVEREGWLSERNCYELLHCYRRSELALAAERIRDAEILFVAGLGLYHVDWMERLRVSFVEWLENVGVLSLTEVVHESRERWPQLVQCEDATIEALLGLWPEIQVRRSSIFDAVVEVVDQERAQFIAPNTQEISTDVTSTKKSSREKRAVPKKRIVKEAMQGDLWG